MNKSILIGRLTRNPELRYTPGTGTAVASFTLAVNRRFKKEGYPEADFIPIVVFGKQGENVANYLVKGSQAGVSGRIQTRNYEAKDGTKRYVTEIVADEIQFLDSKNSRQNNSDEEYLDPDVTPVDDGDIPF